MDLIAEAAAAADHRMSGADPDPDSNSGRGGHTAAPTASATATASASAPTAPLRNQARSQSRGQQNPAPGPRPNANANHPTRSQTQTDDSRDRSTRAPPHPSHPSQPQRAHQRPSQNIRPDQAASRPTSSATSPATPRHPFPSYSRTFADAPDYKIAMTSGLPPNKNAFFFVPSYMRRTLYGEQLRDEQRCRLGPGSYLSVAAAAQRDGNTQARGQSAAGLASSTSAATAHSGAGSAGRSGTGGGASGGAGRGANAASTAPKHPHQHGQPLHLITATATTPTAIAGSAAATPTSATRPLEQLSGDMPDSVTNNEDSLYAIVRAVAEQPHRVKPLPTRWVLDAATAEQLKELEVGGDGLELRYLSPVDVGRAQDGCAVRSDHPIPNLVALYYFEIEILRKTKEAMVALGLSAASASSTRLPGYDGETWAYHGDDGRLYSGRQASAGADRSYGPRFGEGDVIGCGYDWKLQKMFFTKNGEFLGHAPDKIVIDGTRELFPTVGVRKKPQIRLRANFGQYPFRYGIDGYAAVTTFQRLTDEALDIVENLPVPADIEGTCRSLVLQYLSHEGFVATTAAFRKDVEDEIAARDGTAPPAEPSGPLNSETRIRAAIRDAILNGRIDSAVQLLRMYYPHAIDADLEFKIRCQKFVELIRRARTDTTAHAQQHTQSHEVDRGGVMGDGDGLAVDGAGTRARGRQQSLKGKEVEVDTDNADDNVIGDGTFYYSLPSDSQETNGGSTTMNGTDDVDQDDDTARAVSRPDSRMDVDQDREAVVSMDIDDEPDISHVPAFLTGTAGAHAQATAGPSSDTAPLTIVKTVAASRYTFSDAMTYGSNLDKLYLDTTSDEGKGRRAKLDEIFSLLAYPDPRDSPSGYLLDEGLVAALAEQVSAACLRTNGGKEFAALDRLWQQSEVMLHDARKVGGLGSILNLREDCTLRSRST
ncbi:Ran-binding protein 9 [Ascosphaera acerosa]|nr:Ran-binding protein 9 [Ascosphaera acerosa]